MPKNIIPSCRTKTNHGLSETRQYTNWQGMHARCRDPKHVRFKNYGGKGITVCEDWHDYTKFIRDMGMRPEGMTLDRIDNSKGYCNANCRWVPADDQMRNTTANVNITFDGKTMCLAEWSRHTGLNYRSLYHRYRVGWSVEDMLTKPVTKKPPKKQL